MEKLKIDFGSGYAHNKDYKSCDITFSPILDFVYDYKKNKILYCKINSVDEFYLRNVVHHLPDIEKTFKCLKKYLKKGGIIKIIDVNKNYFKQNLFLDRLWYRFIIPQNEIWFSEVYRDYKSILKDMNFQVLENYVIAEKEVSVWKKS